MRWIIVIVLLIGFGFAKVPLENRLERAQEEAGFHKGQLNLELREQVGQAGFIAALGGFRALVANLLWVKAYVEWEKTHWEKMRQIFNTVVALQPGSILFWDGAAWHMAFNAAKAARWDSDLPLEELRKSRERYYWEVGEDFYERGIRHNPDRYELYEKMGFLQEKKFQDYCKAAEYYGQAARFENAPNYLERFEGYMLTLCPGKEREAYETLMALYRQGEEQHLPSLIRDINILEEKLGIPTEDQIPEPMPEKPRSILETQGAPDVVQ